MKLLSIVTPSFNEEGGIAACYDAVRRVMAESLPGYAYEHLFIDNASTDRTVEILRAIAAADERVRVIVNTRNFGAARSACHAMLQARGDAMVPILADLQTPPDLLPAMVDLWDRGATVVVARRRASAETWGWRTVRRTFYRVLRSVSRVEQIPDFIGFGLYDRRFLDVFATLNEPEPYFRGLVPEIGFEHATVEYDQPARASGRSSYRIRDYIELAVLALTTYSRAPLRLLTLGGLGAACLTALVALALVAIRLRMGTPVTAGSAPILVAIAFVGALQLFAIGLVGEYVGLLLTYARRFPLVVEDERINDG